MDHSPGAIQIRFRTFCAIAKRRVLNTLPRYDSGDFLFSLTSGKRAVNGFSKAKTQLDTAIAQRSKKIDPWVLHDIRRTVRTQLSGPRVAEPVAEMVIGHARKGLARVYDQHKYLDEMREALDQCLPS